MPADGAGISRSVARAQAPAAEVSPTLTEAADPLEPLVSLAGQCPECSALLVYQGGCLHCRSCGYAKCG